VEFLSLSDEMKTAVVPGTNMRHSVLILALATGCATRLSSQRVERPRPDRISLTVDARKVRKARKGPGIMTGTPLSDLSPKSA
jgi:hypothetical protein